MAAASAAQAYERAAALRDKLEELRWLAERLAWLQSARREHTFIYAVTGDDGRTLWYLLHRGRVRAALTAPRDPTTRQVARAAIESVFAECGRDGGPLPADQMDSILLVAGWFRKHADERRRTLTPAEALELCRTGTALACG